MYVVFCFSLDNDTLRNGTLYNMNLFRSPFRALNPWVADNDYYCRCTNDTIECQGTQNVNCTFKNSIKETKCRSVDVARGRRSVNSHMKEMKRLFQLMHKAPIQNHFHKALVKVYI